MNRFRSFLFSSRGFTLAEVLVAMALITIALLGLTMTVSSGVVSGMSWGQAGATRAYYVSSATALAQERLEQLRRLTYDDDTDQLGSSSSSGPSGFSDEDYGSISGYGNFKREVRVTADSPATNIKTISVKVYYRLPTATGRVDESIIVYTLRAKRPT